jgi:hypothetical protein
MKPHKHAELIKAWADGATIEMLCDDNEWYTLHGYFYWAEDNTYRIKSEVKPDSVLYCRVRNHNGDKTPIHNIVYSVRLYPTLNLKLTFDGETNQLKSAEVIK